MIKNKNLLPPREYLEECFFLDVEAGHLFWKERPSHHFKDSVIRSSIHTAKIWNSRFAGKLIEASAKSGGYANAAINAINYRAHRIIWKMAYGYDPIGIDHIDGDRANNTLGNLREVNQSVNCKNKRMRSDNSSGKTGLHYDKSRQKWLAFINIDGRSKNLGRFDDFEQASKARDSAASGFGYTKRHGLPEERI